MEENREQAQADSACNQERARRRLLQGEEQEERLHDCFGWRLWGMNRIATREWSPSNKTFSPTSFKNRFMKTIARFEPARREKCAASGAGDRSSDGRGLLPYLCLNRGTFAQFR